MYVPAQNDDGAFSLDDRGAQGAIVIRRIDEESGAFRGATLPAVDSRLCYGRRGLSGRPDLCQSGFHGFAFQHPY